MNHTTLICQALSQAVGCPQLIIKMEATKRNLRLSRSLSHMLSIDMYISFRVVRYFNKLALRIDTHVAQHQKLVAESVDKWPTIYISLVITNICT